MLLIYAKFTRPGPVVEATNNQCNTSLQCRGDFCCPSLGLILERSWTYQFSCAFNNSFVLSAPSLFRLNSHKHKQRFNLTLIIDHETQSTSARPHGRHPPGLCRLLRRHLSIQRPLGNPPPDLTSHHPRLRHVRDREHGRHPQGPPATSSVLKAIQSYAGKIRSESCTLTGADELDCPPLDGPQLCGITSALPASASAGFSAYGSSASSWVAANRGEMLRMASECPMHWYEAVNYYDQGMWLNDTINIAGCYEVLKVTGLPGGGGAVATTTGAGSPRPTPGSGATTTPPPVQTTAATNHAVRGFMGEAEKAGIWAVIGGGVAAVAAGGMRH